MLLTDNNDNCINSHIIFEIYLKERYSYQFVTDKLSYHLQSYSIQGAVAELG